MGVYKAKRDRVLTVRYEGGFEVDFKVVNKNDPALNNEQGLMEFAIKAIRGLEYETPAGDVVGEDDQAALIRWVCGDMELVTVVQQGYYDFLAQGGNSPNSRKQRGKSSAQLVA